MARGNAIIVSGGPQSPRGIFMEGPIATAEKPGTIMQFDPTVALVHGRHTWKKYTRDADGNRPLGPLWVLLADELQGKGPNDAYVAGDNCFLYCPVAGDELNVLVLNLSGTADDHAIGELLIPQSGTGKMIATAGSPEIEPFVLLETITDPSADTLAWVWYTGH